KVVQLQKMMADGQKALDAKQFEQAVQIYHDASKLSPGNVDVLAALGKAEHARDDFNRANRQKVEAERAQKVKDLIAGARRAAGGARRGEGRGRVEEAAGGLSDRDAGGAGGADGEALRRRREDGERRAEADAQRPGRGGAVEGDRQGPPRREGGVRRGGEEAR